MSPCLCLPCVCVCVCKSVCVLIDDASVHRPPTTKTPHQRPFSVRFFYSKSIIAHTPHWPLLKVRVNLKKWDRPTTLKIRIFLILKPKLILFRQNLCLDLFFSPINIIFNIKQMN